MKYSYKDESNSLYSIELSDDLFNKSKQAIRDYETSKKYILSQCHWLWRYGEKRYRLDTKDRQRAKNLKSWQSNITGGISRTFIDVFHSSLSKSPVVPMAIPVGETPYDVADNTVTALSFCADKSDFQTESKIIMREGLKTGQYAIRVGYHDNKVKQTYITYDAEGNPTEHTYTKKGLSIPYAKHVPVWNIYPDPYQGAKRYVTERHVTSFTSFMEQFGNIIKHAENKSPLKDADFLKLLPINPNNASFVDFGSITNNVWHGKNTDAMNSDSYYASYDEQNVAFANSAYTQDRDADVTDGLIEVLYTVYNDLIVIHANRYPVYVGPNIFGFINYVIKSATDPTQTLGVEGIPYILSGIEETYDSFVNNLIDSARVTTTPNFIGVKGVFEDESKVEDMYPGDTLWIETPPINGEQPLRRLDKGSVTDNGLMDLMQSIATQKAGISEYNMGIAARERTATGASAVADSDKKRLGPYIDTFVGCVSEVFYMWLDLLIQNWTTPQWVTVTNKDGSTTQKQLQNKDLAGDVSVTLDLDGLVATRNDMNTKRLIEFFPQIMNSGITDNPGEVLAEIFRGLGLNPSRYGINYNKKTPDTELTDVTLTDLPQELTETITPQLNLNQQ